MEVILKKTVNFFICSSVLLVSLFNVSVAYAQEEFQTQITMTFDKSEDDDNNVSEIYNILARQHFSPVNLSNHPYAEAAFLERIGSVAVFYGINNLDNPSFGKADGPLYGGIVTYMKPGFPLVIDAMIAKSDVEFNPPVDGVLTLDTYGLKMSIYVKNGFLIGFGYTRQELEVSGVSVVNGAFDEDTYELSSKFVNKFGNGRAINIEAEVGITQFDDPGDDGSNTTIDIVGDYYFTPGVSFGSHFGLNSGDEKNVEGDTVSVNINTFVSPFFSVALEFEKFFAENSEGTDDDSFHITLLARF